MVAIAAGAWMFAVSGKLVRHGGNELCYFGFWCHLWMEREWIDFGFSWFRLMNVFHGFQHRRDQAVSFTCFLAQSKDRLCQNAFCRQQPNDMRPFEEKKRKEYKSVNEILWNHKYVFIFLFFFAGVFIFYGFATIAKKIVVMQKNIKKRFKMKRSATHLHLFVIYRKI